MNLNLEKKVVIVTGSGRGIGLEIARQFAAEKASVVLTDYNQESLTAAEDAFRSAGYDYLAIPCDVTDEEAVKRLIELPIQHYKRLDVLVNNAGITRDTLLLRMKSAQWDAVMQTNLKGTFLTTKIAAKYFMKQRGGKIINISSVVGLTGNAGQANYAASKAGVIGFSKTVAQELAGRNVTVNVIAPGFIETEMTKQLSENVKTEFMNKIPLKRPGLPADVAQAALFLASPLADYITGQVIKVDGGMVM